MTDCPVDPCNRPAVPGWVICRHHTWTMQRALAETPALARELDLTITRQTSVGARTGPRSSGIPLAYDPAASEALAVLRSTLLGWVRELQPDVYRQPPGTLDAVGMWLLHRVGDLVVHAAAEQAVEEITAATANGWRATDRRVRVRVVLPDGCPECGAQLHAVLHDIGDPRPNLVWCLGEQQHRYEPHQWLRLGHRLGYGREVG